MTTRVIHSLEHKGLVKRVQDKNDKRQNRIYKSEKADEISESVRNDLLRLNQSFTEGISRKDMESFMGTLAVLDANISRCLEKGE